jgi:adenylate kinase family enzyme
VAGTSGSGKTTLARRIAAQLAAPHIEIDALFHGPNWTPRPTFMQEVEDFSARRAWVTEWQYDSARPVLADRTDLMVWLDLPRPLVMSRVIRRTVRRHLRGERLWHGNREAPLWTVFHDREHIIRWAWATHHQTHDRIHAVLEQRPSLPVVRLTRRRDVDGWVTGPLAAAVRCSTVSPGNDSGSSPARPAAES